MSIFSGTIKLSGYEVQHTKSGSCDGSITKLNISGGTEPYTVNWSGVSSYSATTFNIYNLCSGDYCATVTDVNGSTGTTVLTVSAFTEPTISASLTGDDCILDTNKKCVITVTSSQTETVSYRYELRKDSDLIDTHYGTTADTSHTFSDLDNGMYTVTVVEDKPGSITTRPDKTGCTESDYNDGGVYSGMSMSNIFNTWDRYIPRNLQLINFPIGWGPATSGNVEIYDSGFAPDGVVHSDNPYVWLYTGTTSSRKTDTTTDWYLGATAATMTEGQNVGPALTSTVGNIGKFYYNTVINKFVMWWVINTNYYWMTLDPRENFGNNGNPVSIDALTGTTYGVMNGNIDANDHTIDNSGNVALASNVVTVTSGKLNCGSSANNNNVVGMVSECHYNNYTWQVSLNATTSTDDDTLGLVIASFRDDEGIYGPVNVTHTLSLVFNESNNTVGISNNFGATTYGFNRTNTAQFRDCNGGCTTSNPNYGKSVVIKTTNTPFTGGTAFLNQGSIRVKVTRSGELGEQFNIQMTDTMGDASSTFPATGVANPYNPLFDINFNLLDKTSWSGDSASAESWVGNYDLCKYLGSKRIGVMQSSQGSCNWYHMQFTGSPSENLVIAPTCGNLDGPSTTVTITATTGTTTNITTNNPCNVYFSCESGVPKVRPKVKATLQTMPEPNIVISGMSRPNVSVSNMEGGIPELDVYNLSDVTGTNVEYIINGDNEDMVFGNMYPKFRIYPYVFETEEVATMTDYEAIFDTLPSYVDKTTNSTTFSANTFIPFSGLSTGTSWEYIVRPSYLFKDKTSVTDLWVDTAEYPVNRSVNSLTDYYFVLVNDPQTPTLTLDNFEIPTSDPSLKIETETAFNMPDTTATTFSSTTYVYTLRSPNAGKPSVVVNGVTLKEGEGAITSTTRSGDYKFLTDSRAVQFFTETVQNGDLLQFMYDANGGSYTQFITVPNTVPTTSGNTLYLENGYYYINLDKQSSGGVALAINGIIQISEVDYRKSGDKKIQLLRSTSTYNSGDTISLFYRTIFDVIGFTTTKEPEIPVTYNKNNNLEELIVVRMFDSRGILVQENNETIGMNEIGSVYRTFKLKPTAPGNYTYDVLIRRYYPLMNGDTISTESQSELIGFEITNDIFYSP